MKHFLEFNGLKDSVGVFEHEIREKVLENQARLPVPPPRSKSKKAVAQENAEDAELLQILQVNKVPKTEQELVQMPAIYSKFVEDKIISEQEASETSPNSNRSMPENGRVTERDIKQLQRQSGSVLQSARQIFSIAINCLQQLHNIKDGNSMTENLGETIDNYKVQLSKYN